MMFLCGERAHRAALPGNVGLECTICYPAQTCDRDNFGLSTGVACMHVP